MKRSMIALFILLALPAHADERLNTFGVTVDPLIIDAEPPAGDVKEGHWPRVGFEFSRTVLPLFDLFAGAGFHRLRIEEAGAKTGLRLFDYRLGARQYFSPRELRATAFFVDASMSEGWLQDSTSTVGASRRLAGWNASFGMSKAMTERFDMRLALTYGRLTAKEIRGVPTDVLSSVELKITVASRF